MPLLAAALALPLLATVPASACFVCDEVVELDGTRADCFRQGYAGFLEAARRSETSSAEVDLSVCAGDAGRERRGLDRMPDVFRSKPAPEGPEEVALRSVYILDEAGMVCLKRLLDEHKGGLDPKARFDLVEQCRP